MLVRNLLLALSALLSVVSANAVEPLTVFNVVLLQPDAVMQARVRNIDEFAGYVRALQVQARAALPGPGMAGSGFIVMAVRPGLRTNAWLDLDEPINGGVRESLVRQLRSVPAPVVQGGAVVFALKVGIWGGRESRRVAPAPAEWRDAAAAASGPALEPGELVEKIWHD